MKKIMLSLLGLSCVFSIYGGTITNTTVKINELLAKAETGYSTSISNTASITTNLAMFVTATNNLTPIFDTNEVVVVTNQTPRVLGQLLVGATNLYVGISLTTNGWLKIK